MARACRAAPPRTPSRSQAAVALRLRIVLVRVLRDCRGRPGRRHLLPPHHAGGEQQADARQPRRAGPLGQRPHLRALPGRLGGQGGGRRTRRQDRRDRGLARRAVGPARSPAGGRAGSCDRHRLCPLPVDPRKSAADRPRPDASLGIGANARVPGAHRRAAHRWRRAQPAPHPGDAQRHRPVPHPHLPVPAVRRLDPPPPQARGSDQLGAVARGAPDHGQRGALGDLPDLHRPRAANLAPAFLRSRQHLPARRNPAVPPRSAQAADRHPLPRAAAVALRPRAAISTG